jgi:hypothetical protein
MALQIKQLGNGQLPATKQTLYTVPSGQQCIVRSISLVNTDAGAITTNLYAAGRRIQEKDYSMAAGALKLATHVITLGSGDIIEGDASDAAKVDYVISGVETV